MLCCPCRKLQEGFDLNPKPDETAISRHIGYVRTGCFSPCVRLRNANKSTWENRELISYVLEREFYDDVVWGGGVVNVLYGYRRQCSLLHRLQPLSVGSKVF